MWHTEDGDNDEQDGGDWVDASHGLRLCPFQWGSLVVNGSGSMVSSR